MGMNSTLWLPEAQYTIRHNCRFLSAKYRSSARVCGVSVQLALCCVKGEVFEPGLLPVLVVRRASFLLVTVLVMVSTLCCAISCGSLWYSEDSKLPGYVTAEWGLHHGTMRQYGPSSSRCWSTAAWALMKELVAALLEGE